MLLLLAVAAFGAIALFHTAPAPLLIDRVNSDRAVFDRRRGNRHDVVC